MAERPLELAIVGCGAITELAHLPAAARLDGLRVTGLVDRDLRRAETLAARYGVPQAAADAARLDRRPDAVLIALPHHLHGPVSLGFLRRGVHVLVEKPMALTVAECDAMIGAAAAAGARLAVGLVRRFLPVTRLVKAILAGGALGPLASFDVREGRVYDWPTTSDSLFRRETAGGGVLVDAGVHVLDALLFWLGEMEVTACRDDGCGGVEAEAEVHLATAGGARGVVALSRMRELRNTVRLRGAAATLEASFYTGEITLRRGAEVTVLDASADLPCLAGTAEGMDLFRAQLADFAAAVRGGAEPAVPGAEGRRSVALLEACAAVRETPHRETPHRGVSTLGGASPNRAASPNTVETPRWGVSRWGVSRQGVSGRPVLVTGGTGFIGGRLVEKLVLEHGARVRVLVRDFARACRIARCDVELIGGDVTDAAAVARAARGCAAIFHCAYGNRGSAEEQRAVNAGGTETVVRCALEAGVSRLVHVSTISVYGRLADGDLDEATPHQPPGDLYAATKAEGERIVLDAFREHGLPAVVVQPAVVYGPWGLAWTIDPLQQLRSRRVALVDGGEGLCNAVYVDDVCDALILAAAAAAGAPGEAFLISGEEPVTWKAFYAAYERMLGVPATVPRTAAELCSLARRRDGTAPFRVPSEPMIDFFAARTRVRIDKDKKLLGFAPRYDLARGMGLTEAWARWAGLAPSPQ
jgi:predicted dehydrogenase/nucleoside-diphosphate-sugar epimerase